MRLQQPERTDTVAEVVTFILPPGLQPEQALGEQLFPVALNQA